MDVASRLSQGLVPWFDRLPPENHPWWWPAGSGAALADWGLQEPLSCRLEAAAVMSSLRGEKAAGEAETEGFLGSVGSTPDTCALVILVPRPTPTSWPGLGTSRLIEALRSAELLEVTHVTPMIKFRGGPAVQEMLKFPEGFQRGAVHASLNLLAQEVKYLQPKAILVAGQGGAEAVEILSAITTPNFQAFRDLLVAFPVVKGPSWLGVGQSRGQNPTDVGTKWRELLDPHFFPRPVSRFTRQ